MGKETLRDWQRTAIEYVFAQPDAATFYLTGGTALAAFYLNHRVSDDLDFFSDRPDNHGSKFNLRSPGSSCLTCFPSITVLAIFPVHLNPFAMLVFPTKIGGVNVQQ